MAKKMAKKKILVIDDMPNIVTMLKARLEASGYEVIAAFDQIIDRPKLHGADGHAFIPLAGDHDHRYLITTVIDLDQRIQPIAIRHAVIQQDNIVLFGCQATPKCVYIFRPINRKRPRDLEELGDHFSVFCIVINDQHAIRISHYAFSSQLLDCRLDKMVLIRQASIQHLNGVPAVSPWRPQRVQLPVAFQPV